MSQLPGAIQLALCDSPPLSASGGALVYAATTGTSQGDYDGNGTIQANDYNVWKANFGTANAAADGNGIVDASDYTIWRDHLG